MKSEVCKRASRLMKMGYDRRNAFFIAWKRVKYEARCVKAEDVMVGSSLHLEYGDYGNFCDCTVVSKSEKLYYGAYVINAVTKSGMKIEFCAEPGQLIEKAA